MAPNFPDHKHLKFPLELAYRVRNYFKNFLREKNALDERRILQELSTRLRILMKPRWQ